MFAPRVHLRFLYYQIKLFLVEGEKFFCRYFKDKFWSCKKNVGSSAKRWKSNTLVHLCKSFTYNKNNKRALCPRMLNLLESFLSISAPPGGGLWLQSWTKLCSTSRKKNSKYRKIIMGRYSRAITVKYRHWNFQCWYFWTEEYYLSSSGP